MSFSTAQRAILGLVLVGALTALAAGWIGIAGAAAGVLLGAACVVALAHPPRGAPLPGGVAVYEVTEAFLVGFLPRTISALCENGARVIVLRMDAITSITDSDAAALESVFEIAQGAGCLLVLASLRPQPYTRLTERSARIRIFSHVEDALEFARIAVSSPVSAGAAS